MHLRISIRSAGEATFDSPYGDSVQLIETKAYHFKLKKSEEVEKSWIEFVGQSW